MSRPTDLRSRPRTRSGVVLAALAVVGFSCGDSTTTPTSGASRPDRSYDVFVPTTYDESVPMPLVLLLHALTFSGDVMESIVELQPVAEERGFLYVHPDGTKNANGDRFWNATDGCCNASDLPVDDSAYLASIIGEIKAAYNVDPRRIYLVGVSNGGFMSYRMACDHADTIAAIVSVAGATFLDAETCRPSQPVNVLEIHGTADGVVPYEGGALIGGRPFPSAATTVADWAAYNGCGSNRLATGVRLDLDVAQPGAETEVSGFDGCPAGGAVELWTVADGAHLFEFTPAVTPSIVEFLFAHAKP